MSDDTDDLAVPPDDILIVERARTGHGWSVRFDGETQAFFSTAADLASWVKTVLHPLDIEAGVIPRPELKTHDNDPLPSILHDKMVATDMVDRKPARMWRIFQGGKR